MLYSFLRFLTELIDENTDRTAQRSHVLRITRHYRHFFPVANTDAAQNQRRDYSFLVSQFYIEKMYKDVGLVV